MRLNNSNKKNIKYLKVDLKIENNNNFDEVYSMLSRLNISAKINTTDSMSKLIQKRITYKQKIRVAKRLNALGKNILKNNIYEINKFL